MPSRLASNAAVVPAGPDAPKAGRDDESSTATREPTRVPQCAQKGSPGVVTLPHFGHFCPGPTPATDAMFVVPYAGVGVTFVADFAGATGGDDDGGACGTTAVGGMFAGYGIPPDGCET
jgi:hypothetical protein